MGLTEQIMEEIKSAMKSKDTARLGALRLIKNDLMKAEEAQGKALAADGEQAVLKKMAKQRRDSITQFRAGAREDLAAKEEVELKVIESFLPAALSPDQIEQVIEEVLTEVGSNSPATSTGMIIGRVMGKLKATGLSFDGKQVNDLVLKHLKP